MWDFHPDVGLIVAGGQQPQNNKVELSTDYGQTKESLGNLPYGCDWLSSGCMIILNKTTVFLAGGQGGCSSGSWSSAGLRETYYLNIVTGQWTEGPLLSEGRRYHQCGLLNKPSPQIVVVGGINQNSWTDHVDIIDLETNTTTEGEICNSQ